MRELRECYANKDIGVVDITSIRQWIAETKQSVSWQGFTFENAAEMLANHAWDEDSGERWKLLKTMILKEKNIPPLIVVHKKAELKDGEQVYLIDGWHRLAVLYELCEMVKREHVVFPCHRICFSDLELFRPVGDYVAFERNTKMRTT